MIFFFPLISSKNQHVICKEKEYFQNSPPIFTYFRFHPKISIIS